MLYGKNITPHVAPTSMYAEAYNYPQSAEPLQYSMPMSSKKSEKEESEIRRDIHLIIECTIAILDYGTLVEFY
jgi:hypothetical protein